MEQSQPQARAQSTNLVAVMVRKGQDSWEEIDGMRMPYQKALAHLRKVQEFEPRNLKYLDLCYVQADGTLGRMASWVL